MIWLFRLHRSEVIFCPTGWAEILDMKHASVMSVVQSRFDCVISCTSNETV